jgi:hypothetical protein
MRAYYRTECHGYVRYYFRKYFEHCKYVDFNSVCKPSERVTANTVSQLESVIEKNMG